MRPLRNLLVLACVVACSAPRPDPLTHWIRVGTDARVEAERLVASLERAGYTLEHRIESPRFVALGFVRGADERRAIRVVTRLGVAVSLDSHESDGVRVRHGPVRLVRSPSLGPEDGQLLVARDGPDGACLSIVQIDPEGRPSVPLIEAEHLATGACATDVADLDGDGRPELVVGLTWPDLALSEVEVPQVQVPLVARAGAWRAEGIPSDLETSEQVRLARALAEARRALDVARASRLGVERAALAHLTGASREVQLARYDAALAGLVLRPDQRDQVIRVRAYIAGGWSADQE